MQRIYYGEDIYQYGELMLPETPAPHPVVVIIHGGFWKTDFDLDLTREIAMDLTAAGWATWNIEYNRIGQNGGGWPGSFRDVADAMDHLIHIEHEYRLDLDRVVTLGHSAGGHFALWLAGRHRLPDTSELFKENFLAPGAAVSLAGISDLSTMHMIHAFRDQELAKPADNPTAELMGGSPLEVPERYREGSPKELLPLSTAHILFHGSLDVNVPVGMSDDYHEWAENIGDPVKYIRLTDTEHFMFTDPSTRAWKKVKEEMELLLKHL
ncbi:alpha/beta hydrolase family protein [Salimicrobium humidisoli]|uniref:Alpha/beta hydrolase n=1 Tax=Salimicrobium humidisoli TaxID=2029857 RepID=A0ABX4HQV6_9BACI|nr:alpha/beta hydrolase [Salimicrobium humidisoli]PBB05095.1 alpha/beta hydrolase [Salimicrobium humidisoli]